MGVLAVQSLCDNIMASTLMASTAIMLSSVIAVLMMNSGGWPSKLQEGRVKLVLGDASELGLTIKFFAILACFLLACFFEVQVVRFYSHSSILINVPIMPSSDLKLRQQISPEMVAKMLDKGNYFWSVGLRCFYVSFPLFWCPCLSGFPPPLLGHGFSRRGRRGLERGGRTWFGMLKVVRQLIGSAQVERSK